MGSRLTWVYFIFMLYLFMFKLFIRIRRPGREMSNTYIDNKGMVRQGIFSIKREYIGSFSRNRQWHR